MRKPIKQMCAAATIACCLGGTAMTETVEKTLAPLPQTLENPPVVLTLERAQLGRLLFFENRLSGDASISCASCHDPAEGFGDGADLARGYPGTVHWRNSQTIVNSVFLSELHWDGSEAGMIAQGFSALHAPMVLNISETMAEERLKQVPLYVELFEKAWGEAPSVEKALLSIVAYEATKISADSPFDNYMLGDQMALSPPAKRGMALFKGKARCIECHNGPLLTDQAYHNLGVPKNPEFERDPLRQITFRERMRNSGIPEEQYAAFDRDPGRFMATKAPSDLGKFRTAPLRYLVYTPPYMHNGVFFTLEEVVEFYNAGGGQDPFGTKSDMIRPLGLTGDEINDVVAFLQSMSGTEVRDGWPQLPDYESSPIPAAKSN